MSDHGDGARRLTGLAAGLAVTLVAIAATLAFALTTEDGDGRAIARAAALHELAPTGPPPRPDAPPPGTGPRPAAPPPGWPPQGPAAPGVAGRAIAASWVPIGTRSDRVANRAAETIIFRRGGQRLGYTVIAGEIPGPDDARRLGRGGLLLRSFDDDGRTVVTWSRMGITEVVSSIGLSRAELYDIAGGPAGP